MTTYERGDRFEIIVEGALRAALTSKRLGLLPESATVYRRKGYFSKDRNDIIIIDVSIEVVLPGATAWSILWAWECKDYDRPIEVGKVEEFYSKLLQIGGANVKGGFASAGPLQRAALQYARSKGITVARVKPGFIDIVANYSTGPLQPPPSAEDVITAPSGTPPRWSDGPVSFPIRCCAISSQGQAYADFVLLVEHEIEAGINAISRHEFNPTFDEQDAITRIAKWFGERPAILNDRPIRCSYVEKVLGLPENSGPRLIPLAVARFNRFVEDQTEDLLLLGPRKIKVVQL